MSCHSEPDKRPVRPSTPSRSQVNIKENFLGWCVCLCVCASIMYNQARHSVCSGASSDIFGHRQAVASEPCGRGKACQAFLWGRSIGVVACIQRACWRCAKPCGALMQLGFCLLTFQSFRLKRALATAVLATSPPPPALML